MDRGKLTTGGYETIFVSACLLGFSNNPTIPLHNNIINTTCIIAGLAGAVMVLVGSIGRPGRLLSAAVLVPLVAIVGYGLTYGIMWYFGVYLPNSGKPLLKLGP